MIYFNSKPQKTCCGMNMNPGQFPNYESPFPIQTNETTGEYGYFRTAGLW